MVELILFSHIYTTDSIYIFRILRNRNNNIDDDDDDNAVDDDDYEDPGGDVGVDEDHWL